LVRQAIYRPFQGLEIKEGKIVAWIQYYDRSGLPGQPGMLPQNPGH
jgi:hypothetical protein